MLSYFYIIKFSITGQYYAGSRYTKKLSETNIKNDLWYRYFTSSKIVKMLIKKFGKDAFVIKKIKVFYTKDGAKEYESRFLRKIDAKNSPKMLNQSNSVFDGPIELQWITDGTISTMILKGKPLLPGFRLGRTNKHNHNRKNKNSKLKNRIHVIDINTNDRMMIPKNDFDPKKHVKANLAYNKNRTWIYNPITGESKIIKDNISIPAGWLNGNPRRQKTIWYHDPDTQINYQIKEDKTPPSHLKKGRFYPFAWYTNPITNDNILCNKADVPPAGYVKGRSMQKNITKELFASMKGH